MVNWFDIGLIIGLIMMMYKVQKLVITPFLVLNKNEKDRIGLINGLILLRERVF